MARVRVLKHPEDVGEPPGTIAQALRYVDGLGMWRVEGFRYVREDGRIGASGLLDPKRLVLGNAILAADTEIPRRAR
jgi:hypothetical protein